MKLTAEMSSSKDQKNGGKYFVWTAADERKVFAFIDGQSDFFGNDEDSIEKCLAAKNGKADNLTKNSELQPFYEAANKLTFGFVSGEGIEQIADLTGV